jgi:hypothetical protein
MHLKDKILPLQMYRTSRRNKSYCTTIWRENGTKLASNMQITSFSHQPVGFKYWFQVPMMHHDAMLFGNKAGSTLWKEAEAKESKALTEYKVFQGLGIGL